MALCDPAEELFDRKTVGISHEQQRLGIEREVRRPTRYGTEASVPIEVIDARLEDQREQRASASSKERDGRRAFHFALWSDDRLSGAAQRDKRMEKLVDRGHGVLERSGVGLGDEHHR